VHCTHYNLDEPTSNAQNIKDPQAEQPANSSATPNCRTWLLPLLNSFVWKLNTQLILKNVFM